MSTSPDLGHNPDATQEELIKFRENFDLKAHLQAAANAPRADTTPIPPKAPAAGSQLYGPNATVTQPRRADTLPGSINSGVTTINVEELKANLAKVGLEIVPIREAESATDEANQDAQE